MKASIIHHRTLALAGVFQAASLVKQLAKTGRADEKYFLASIQSLFKIDAPTVMDVYEGVPNVTLGLKELQNFFTNNKAPKDADIARYVLSLLHLEKKLNQYSTMNDVIHTGLLRAKTQAAHFGPTHENVMANLASIYTDSLSTFSFRIQIIGEPIYLNQTYTVNKARALLLAGIRSAVLWRQMGGRRWQLLISRTSMIQAAKDWINSVAELETA